MKYRPLTIAAALAAAFLTSCAPNSPQGRIEKEPARYGGLSNSDKALVEQGKIKTGMSADAVYLAWGKPQSVSKGGSGNDSTEKWLYTAQAPVWTNNISVGIGPGYGHYGGGYYDYGPSITYLPYTAGIVHFTNGRVTKWEESGR
jgi:hypothetical protein